MNLYKIKDIKFKNWDLKTEIYNIVKNRIKMKETILQNIDISS